MWSIILAFTVLKHGALKHADKPNKDETTTRMTLTLTYNAETNVPVEIEGLTPDFARDKRLSEIERFEIYHGNRKLPLADFFSVSGDPTDEHIEFFGDLSGVHWIGAKMQSGVVHVQGNAGRHLGSEMSGGEICVAADAGDWVGGEMHGGRIHIHGNTGHLVGAAYRGSRRGMTGGSILVEGNAGNEIGLTMRRGTIAIGGKVGDVVGFNMLAGTVLVFGSCGIRHGANMTRGTIGLLGPDAPDMLPTFRLACRFRPQALGLLLVWLARQNFPFDESLHSAMFDLYNGDFLEGGRGEILVRT